MKIKKIHFTGIKGVGMTPLAIIAREAGMIVTGSDIDQSFITDEELKKAGIQTFVGFSQNHVKNIDLLIATGAHGGAQNVEVKAAEGRGIKVLNQGQALGMYQSGEFFNRNTFGVSVAGSHGKTTSTAIISTILSVNKLDPSYVIGTGRVPSLGLSGHYGRGSYFVTEADEYPADVEYDKKPKFLYQNPEIILITNIDFDHPDVFKDIGDINNAFLKFLENLPKNGILIACGDGEKNRNFLSLYNGKKITYGFSSINDYVLDRVNFDDEKMFFRVKSGETDLGEFVTHVFGEHNALNCLGSIVVGIELGLSVEQIKNGIKAFRGTKRRAEYIGSLRNGQKLYDDYAHHPLEITETLKAFKKSFPKFKIIPIFQPHMFSRTKALFDDFTNAFNDADQVIITELFSSFREKVDNDFTTKQLVEKINQKQKKATYFLDMHDVVEYISSQNFPKDTIFITMGAGDIYKLGKEILDNG